MITSRSFATFTSGILIGAAFFSIVAFAWTGPTGAPPNSNVSAPINIGTTDQVKNAGLALNSLAVFGDAILSGTSHYLNFGSLVGTTGYGIRDNAGVMEVKDSAGAWASFATGSSTQSFTTTVFTSTVAGGSATSHTCPVGQYVVSATQILVPSGTASCQTAISADKKSATYGQCGVVSGQNWRVQIVCGGNTGAPNGWTGLSTNFTRITAEVLGTELVACSGSPSGYYCNNSAPTSCPAGTTLVTYGLEDAQGYDSSNSFQYHTCNSPSANQIRANLLLPAAGNPNYSTKCWGLCVAN